MKLRDLACLIPLVLLAASCNTLKSDTADKEPAAAKAEQADKDGKEDKESQADKQRKAERELEYARVELKIARQECQAAERKHKDEIEAAEFDLVKAREELDQFQKVAKGLELDKVKLSLERSVQNVDETKAELEELLSMYKKEEFASATKELVLMRGRKRLEFANRALEQDKIEASTTRDFELPRKQRDLEMALKKSENSLREARAEQVKLADENELKLKKAERAVDDAERELAKLKADAMKDAKAAKK
ncbi:MAG: hypothetical protein JNL28_17105 [Planctomycetes bacterium]|nr:hypothetical protein [Planctomycetota bacterium]